MADISKIKLPNNSEYDIRDAKKTGIYPVIGTQTAATGSWTGNIDVPALYDGLTIAYYLPYNGSGNATLNLTLNNGNTTGAINCYYSSGRLTTHYTYGMTIIMTYWSAGSIKVNGTVTTDNRWIAQADYNSDGTGYYTRKIYTNMKAGSNKIFPYTLIMQLPDGRWESIVTSSSTGTSKARNTNGFLLGHVLCHYANATVNADSDVGTYNIWSAHSGLIDHRYSFNTANDATNGTTRYKPIYLVGTISNGLFYLDTKWWTQTLPTSDDGKVYIFIGDAYDYYRMTLSEEKPMYVYKNGAVREYTQDAGTVNGLTVQTAVPSGAKFTDTTYESKAAASGGTAVSLVTTGEKYTWNNKSTVPTNHASTATTYGVGSSSNYGHVKLSSSTSSTSAESGGIAATPSAVKTAYDLANDAKGIANEAKSGVNGTLIYDHTYTISNGTATFTAHVYCKGAEVTSSYADSCFSWSYKLANSVTGTPTVVPLGTGKTKTVTISQLGYGGYVLGTFTPPA